ncbi:kynurenine formamidase isoform X1 [Anabrus simplex]|uniref:kynurenine formamidase isoform X2 n=1 Tax=Anabrus simplex TaxID=316456 RepID=UPI0034DD04BC
MDPEIDRQYSPRMWSQRLPPEEVVKNHVAVARQASEAAKAAVPCVLGVQYGPTEGQRLDIYGGENIPKDAPIVVYIHGGYWQELSKDISSYCVQPLYKAGIRVIILGYDLAPRVRLGDIVEEMNAAGKYILDLAQKLQSRSVWFMGHCAGAHLIMMLLTSDWFNQLPESQQSLVQGCVLISGIYDLAPLVYTHLNPALDLTIDEIELYSAFPKRTWIPLSLKDKLKVLVTIAAHDSPEFKRQNEEFQNLLRKTCKQVEFLTVPNVDHFDTVENLQNEDFTLTKRIIHLIKY